ncbi:MAG: flavodoxin family protein [Candidatus Freyarchaeota archaeon]
MLYAVGVSGSPRKGGNTDYLLGVVLGCLRDLGFETRLLRVADYDVKPCVSCWTCVERGECCIDDEMSSIIIPEVLKAHVLVLGSPVHFDNVSSFMKTFMDRTWPLRGRLRGKVGGGCVVGRGYGLDLALAAIHSFMLKHEVILCHRGVRGVAYRKGEVSMDKRAMDDAAKLAEAVSKVALKLYEH